MTKQRHIELHQSLDELVAEFISSTRYLPSRISVLELMRWSHQQTLGDDTIFSDDFFNVDNELLEDEPDECTDPLETEEIPDGTEGESYLYE